MDTAVAHLAGALGKPVWLLLPEIGDFRWLEGREDSPWYPTMRLFRQQRLGEWDEVVERVAKELRGRPSTARRWRWIRGYRSRPCVPDDQGDSEPAPPEGIAQVAESRHGILQYFPNASDSARSIAWYGEDLQGQLDLLLHELPLGAQVMEAGSSVGTHTVAMAKRVGAGGHVFAFESDSRTQQVLRQNIEANGVGDVVTQMRRALGAQRSATVDTVDSLLLDRLDLIKIRDVASAAAILEGASASMWRLRPRCLSTFATQTHWAMWRAGRGRSATDVGGWKRRCTPASNYNRRDTDIFNAETALALLAIPEEMPLAAAPDGCTEVSEPNPRTSSEGEQGLLGFLRKLIR